ncbi:MAG: tRNA 5-methoxyuridine(34)/uridine 5-oxyacetic acid(34) synthase CmoB [Woeseia sp.]|jgi:tRNA (mo5U34)-methyltransferase|nr:tRNA 5-methoxyuridine(34)/uridine 5-oxyacetic acid(34) synthase CmoB [Woeseia sp.]MBT6209434.1 tRNA 5-methoxyuridine(34)/uridine 5-oxyacetic acid(34) synthase CmoB [Woeseia sp.]
MFDLKALFSDLNRIGLTTWQSLLEKQLSEKLAPGVHGNLEDWQHVVTQLPSADGSCLRTHPNAIEIVGEHLEGMLESDLRELLMGLTPWRKGPFKIQDIALDTEWRSDFKWNRIRDKIQPLAGRNVLDVGCGNGYYALKMHEAGAETVIGIDPTLLFVCQFSALKKMSGVQSVHVMPLRLHELPDNSKTFDTTFSMGVLYHQRNPQEHLTQLRKTLRSGGELILETLVLPGSGSTVLEPKERYARMRNVWHLPTISVLTEWLQDANYADIRVIDVSTTTIAEQRATDWMPFESLSEALDAKDPSLTIEGYPAPTRAVVACASNGNA